MAKTTDWNKRFDNIRLAKLDYEEKDIKGILNNLYTDDNENKIICEDIYRFDNLSLKKGGQLCWDTDRLLNKFCLA